MPYFGSSSLRHLNTLHYDLREILLEAIELYDFSVICGHRSEQEQNEAYNNGKSDLQWPESKHNKFPSKAVDIAPYYKSEPHIRWNRLYEFVYLQGIIAGIAKRHGILIRHGINWDMDDELITDQNLADFPHLELL